MYLPQLTPVALSLSVFVYLLYRDNVNYDLENLRISIDKLNQSVNTLDNNQKELAARLFKAQRDIHKYGKASKRQRFNDKV